MHVWISNGKAAVLVECAGNELMEHLQSKVLLLWTMCYIFQQVTASTWPARLAHQAWLQAHDRPPHACQLNEQSWHCHCRYAVTHTQSTVWIRNHQAVI